MGVKVKGGGGLRIVLGCKVDKIFLWAPWVLMERQVPSDPWNPAEPLATNCWPEVGGGGGLAS